MALTPRHYHLGRLSGAQRLRAITLYVIALAGLLAAYYAAIDTQPIALFLDLNAKAMGILSALAGVPNQVTGNVVIGEGAAVKIAGECTALASIAVFSAGVFAFPASMKSKVLGVALGTLILLGVNLVRTTSLFLVGTYLPGLMDFAHLVVWQSAMIVLAVGLWLAWWKVIGTADGRA